MNCPSCGRALAAGTRTCVYCGQGSTFKRREPLAVPRTAVGPRKRTIPWGRILFVAVLAVAGLALLQPQVRAQALALLAQLKSFF